MARALRRSISMFVEQAKKLEPRYLSMVIPSRWFAGGKGLDEFRESMLADNRLRSIVDYLRLHRTSSRAWRFKGGVCYFLWDRDNHGDVQCHHAFQGRAVSTASRPLLEAGATSSFAATKGCRSSRRSLQSRPVSRVAVAAESKRFDRLVSSRKPFGLRHDFQGQGDQG